MPLDPSTEVHLVNSIDEVWAMKRWFSEDRGREVLGLDIETDGLDAWAPKAEVRTIQIGDLRAGWTVPAQGWGGAVIELLNEWKGTIALHHCQFDVKYMKRHLGWDIPWSQIHDTMIMCKIMRPGKSAALKDAAVDVVDPRANAGQHVLKEAMAKQGWGWDNIPLDYAPFWTYASLDPIITAHLWKELRADIHYPDVFDLEMGAVRVCTEMEYNGARVDVEYAEKKYEELNTYVDQTKAWVKDNYGFSLGSNAKLAEYFLSVGGQIEKFTPSGAPSVNAEQLEIFSKHSDPKIKNLAEIALNCRKADKLAGTYMLGIMEKHRDGYIHPNINTMGAGATSRMSSSNPNLQNLPSNAAIVKNAYIPREGNLLLTSDLDQVEQRLAASLSQDQGLIDAFKLADTTGPDYFTTLARNIFNDPSIQKKDHRRGLTKTFIYAKSYGASPTKLSLSSGVSVAEVEKFLKDYDSTYTRMTQFSQEIIETIKRRGYTGDSYVQLPLTGRRLPVERDKPYKGFNYLIQGTAAEIMKRNLLRIEAQDLLQFCVVPVHDEIVLDVPKELIDEVGPIVVECMTTRDDFAVPLTADISGPYERWGQKYNED